MDFNLSEEQIAFRDVVRRWVNEELPKDLMRKLEADEENYPFEIWDKLKAQGFFGVGIPEEWGGLGGDVVTQMIFAREMARTAGGLLWVWGLTSFGGAKTIGAVGSDEQKERWLRPMAAGDLRVSLSMTEPDGGTDVLGAMKTFAEKVDGGWKLNGAKMWISNSPKADIAVVWAKNEAGEIVGLIVERGMAGFTTPTIHDKWSLRASATGELVFDHVRVPKQNILPNIKGLKGPLSCLSKARYGIAWGALGAAMDCYFTALKYSQERIQFGKPIGAFQLQQKKLAEMITEITKAQLMVWRIGVLMNEDRATPQQISMAKRNSCEMATNIVRDARQILGGMGITGEFSIMRHMMNLESVITYEGTHDIHLLITGMDITGFNAFK